MGHELLIVLLHVLEDEYFETLELKYGRVILLKNDKALRLFMSKDV